jgi:hypothetical protein
MARRVHAIFYVFSTYPGPVGALLAGRDKAEKEPSVWQLGKPGKEQAS